MSFSPYEDNGGTTLALSGKDFCIIAGDTRLSKGYSIQTRNCTKLVQLTTNCVLVSAGCQADISTLHKVLKARLAFYENAHGKEMSVTAIAQMLSNILYYKRFFPYYTFNLVAGLDAEGKGAVFGYDAIGSYQRISGGAQGSGQTLIQPLLDNQRDFKMQTKPRKPLDKDAALDLVKDAFTGAGQRDIHTGDSVEIRIITKKGIEEQMLQLRED